MAERETKQVSLLPLKDVPLVEFMNIGSRNNLKVERRTRDGKVASSCPGRSSWKISFSTVNFVCWLLFGVHSTPRVTAVARKRPRSFCQKSKWQVTSKHAYTFDPTKSEWVDYAVQA